jgi:replicative superfamily II helicase
MSQTLDQNKKVVLIVSHKVIAQRKTAILTRVFNRKKVGRTFEDLSKDSQVLAHSDVIVTTAEAWDVLTRRWKSRKGFSQVALIVIDNLHLLG